MQAMKEKKVNLYQSWIKLHTIGAQEGTEL
jgi:hypothetical protein